MTLPELQIDESVRARSFKVSDTRGSDPVGHFEIMLPGRFRPVDLPPNTPSNAQSPVRVALYQTVEGPLTQVEITGMFLRREMAPADVLKGVLGAERRTVESRRVPSKGGDLLDALTRQPGADGPLFARWWTVKDGGANGGRLYLIEARVSERHYAQVEAEIASILASFRLLNPTAWDYNERLSQHTQRTPNNILFFYPESWQLKEVHDGSEGPYVADLWQVVGNRLLGRINVVSQADEESVTQVIERHAETLGAPVSWAEREESAPFAGLERAWIQRGRTALNDTFADISVHVAQGNGKTVLLSAAGIPTRADALAAATLQRAREIIQETFRIAP